VYFFFLKRLSTAQRSRGIRESTSFFFLQEIETGLKYDHMTNSHNISKVTFGLGTINQLQCLNVPRVKSHDIEDGLAAMLLKGKMKRASAGSS
jgi:hypothetical protein